MLKLVDTLQMHKLYQDGVYNLAYIWLHACMLTVSLGAGHALFLAISELLSSDTGRLKQRAAAQARVAEAQKAQQAGPSGDADKEAKAKDKEKGKGKKGRRK